MKPDQVKEVVLGLFFCFLPTVVFMVGIYLENQWVMHGGGIFALLLIFGAMILWRGEKW
jgi:hypothetical protein